MITSISNPQMKRIKELLNKSKQRRKEKCFVAEGIRMVAETPADRLERVYVSESFYRHPPELRGLDLSKALIVDDQVFRQVSDTDTSGNYGGCQTAGEQSGRYYEAAGCIAAVP